MTRSEILGQIRYAERLCQRTARLYRRVQTVSVIFAVLGGSATLTALGSRLPHSVAIVGALILAFSGAYSVAARPFERAVANEADVRKYATLRTRAAELSDADLERALLAAMESDAAEIEPLRDVAWNDVVREIGREDAAVPLRTAQCLLALVA
jgi:hypothetical protein